ncbi:MAG: 50S ribosomal protein L25 [Thermomicrobiales bacterium]
MADELTLRAEPRTVFGKKVGRLRREGLVPGVVYGPVIKDTIAVTVNARDFGRFYNRIGHSTVFSLAWGDESQPVLIREVQIDPVRGNHLHIDFFAPNMRVKLRQTVAVVIHNHHADAQGMLSQPVTEIEVEALPADLPSQIDIDISALLEIGDQFKVSDVVTPSGVEIITDPEETIASLIAEALDEPEEEEEEAAEGDEEAGEDGAEATEGAESEEKSE